MVTDLNPEFQVLLATSKTSPRKPIGLRKSLFAKRLRVFSIFYPRTRAPRLRSDSVR